MARKELVKDPQSKVVGICDSLQRNRQFIGIYVHRTLCDPEHELTKARFRWTLGQFLTMRRLDRGPVDLALSFFGICATNTTCFGFL